MPLITLEWVFPVTSATSKEVILPVSWTDARLRLLLFASRWFRVLLDITKKPRAYS